MNARLPAAALGAALLFATAAASAQGVTTAETSLGPTLVDANGMTLYTYTEDTAGTTNCYGQCATNWPPLLAEADAVASGDYTLVDRTDGTKQWAYKGQPLYLWIQDKAAGDTTGDGVGGKWMVAKP